MKSKAVFLLVPVAGLVLFAATGLAREEEGKPYNGNGEAKRYVAQLHPLNDSGVSGTVTLEVRGEELRVETDLTGLAPDQPHPLYIHGFRDDQQRAASCPPTENGNGTMRMEQLVEQAGQPLVEIRLSEEVGQEGELKTQETFRVEQGALEPLGMRLVAVHGATVNGTYDPSVPAACGRLEEKDRNDMNDHDRSEDEQRMEEHDADSHE